MSYITFYSILNIEFSNMGRIVSKHIKRIGMLLFERGKELSSKKFEDIKEILKKQFGNKLTKRERNRLAGYIARLARNKTASETAPAQT